MDYTYPQALQRLERLRNEFAELRAANLDGGLSDHDAARAVDLRAEISVLSAHAKRLERFEALRARSGRNGRAL